MTEEVCYRGCNISEFERTLLVFMAVHADEEAWWLLLLPSHTALGDPQCFIRGMLIKHSVHMHDACSYTHKKSTQCVHEHVRVCVCVRVCGHSSYPENKRYDFTQKRTLQFHLYGLLST